MATGAISFLSMLACSLLLDAAIRPRRQAGLRWQGLLSHLLCMTAVFGLFLAGSGSAPVAAVLGVAMMALVTITSNAKYAMLGEPLLFSDLALIAALFRHPRFYFTAVSWRLRWGLLAAAPILLLVLTGLFVPRVLPHLVGLGMLLLGAGALSLLLGSKACQALARTPDVDADLAHHGMIATLLLYWMRWRSTPDPPPCSASMAEPMPTDDPAEAMPPELIVIVQCESFADPVELTIRPGDALPGLAHARASAWQWGDVAVKWFGAYTMRTEYGVLLGRSEEELGFRRYDPFLTAHGETSYALPVRLQRHGYRCAFIHPHEMRFYGRDRLMPAIGFDRVIGAESFAAVPPGNARYIDDRTLGDLIGDLIDRAAGPTLLYAVTMENHGPWMRDRSTGSPGGLEAYLRHLRNSDAMLTDLIARLSGAGRSALLVFFGDHRPSIPGVNRPGGARHTPYVMLRFSADGGIVTGANRRADLSPAELHHAILRSTKGLVGPSAVGIHSGAL